MSVGDNCLGNRIRELREMNGFSRETLAGMAGISSKYLYELESGKKHLSADILSRLAKSLNVSCDLIIYGYEEERKAQLEIVSVMEQMNTKQFWAIKKMIKTMADICDIFEV